MKFINGANCYPAGTIATVISRNGRLVKLACLTCASEPFKDEIVIYLEGSDRDAIILELLTDCAPSGAVID